MENLHLSEFTKVKKALQGQRCSICGGVGVVDDAEPGDIQYNKYQCSECGGTGWFDGRSRELVICETA